MAENEMGKVTQVHRGSEAKVDKSHYGTPGCGHLIQTIIVVLPASLQPRQLLACQ